MLAKIKNIADEKDIIFSLERVGLDPDSDKKVKKFSLGMKQRLNIAQAIFENQKLYCLMNRQMHWMKMQCSLYIK